MWMDVKYEPGTVKGLAYDTNGKVAEEKEIKRQVNHTRLFWMQTEKPSQARISLVTVSSVVDKMEFLVQQQRTSYLKCSGGATTGQPEWLFT
jgi:beta-galactosidase